MRRDRLQAIGGFDPEMRGAEDLEMILHAIYGYKWAYDPVPSTQYRCNNPESHSRKFATNPTCLTAKLRTFIKHQKAYSIPESLLKGIARTTMSKAITECDPLSRHYVNQLVKGYLSPTQKIAFRLAQCAPQAYLLMNNLRQAIKGANYRPRKVITESD